MVRNVARHQGAGPRVTPQQQHALDGITDRHPALIVLYVPTPGGVVLIFPDGRIVEKPFDTHG